MSERKNVSLNELMGSAGGGAVSKKKELGLNDLENILGERMPKLEFNPVGRLRLTQALRKRFGDDYKNLPGISSILKQFDDEAKFAVRVEEIKQIKYAKKGK